MISGTNQEVWNSIPTGSIVVFKGGCKAIKMHDDAYDGITGNWVTIIRGPDAGRLLHIYCFFLASDPFQNEFEVKHD